MMIVRVYIEHACKANGVPDFAASIHVKYSNRLTTSGGNAKASTNTITIGIPYMEAATQEQFRNTVIHETCHLITRAKYGRTISAHGPEWKQAMRNAGVPPKRTHNVITKNHLQYRCRCVVPRVITRTQYKKMLNQQRLYRCNQCHCLIRLEDIIHGTAH